MSVARGNIVLADHGQTVSETYPPVSDSGPTTIVARPSYRFPLRRGPVSGRIAPREERGLPASATSILADEGHDVEPQVDLQVHTLGDVLVDWHPVPNLLESQSMEHHFVVETEDDGRASVRFGSRGFGREPPDDSFIVTTYRVGVGRAGNIGAEALAHVIDPGNVTNWPVVDAVRNPMPATGGVDPEASERVKQLAPAAFRNVQYRAVTADDYARIAERHPEVVPRGGVVPLDGQLAHGLRRNRPEGAGGPVGRSPAARRATGSTRTRRRATTSRSNRRPSFRSRSRSPSAWPRSTSARTWSRPSRMLSTRARGFFRPDNFTFGQPLYLSRLYAALERIEGVDSSAVTVFKRYAKVAADELETGVLGVERTEVVRLDNDPNFPERGLLRLRMVGGK